MQSNQLEIFEMGIKDIVTLVNTPSVTNLDTTNKYVRTIQNFFLKNYFDPNFFNPNKLTLKIPISEFNSDSLINATNAVTRINNIKDNVKSKWVIHLDKSQYQEFWGDDINVDNLVGSSLSAVRHIDYDKVDKFLVILMDESFIQYNFKNKPGILKKRMFHEYLQLSADKPILYNFIMKVISMEIYRDKTKNKYIIIPKTREMDQIEFINLTAHQSRDNIEDQVKYYLSKESGRQNFSKLLRRLEDQINEMFKEISGSDSTEGVCSIKRIVYKDTIDYYLNKHGKRKDYKNGVAIIFPNWEELDNSSDLEFIELKTEKEFKDIINNTDFSFSKAITKKKGIKSEKLENDFSYIGKTENENILQTNEKEESHFSVEPNNVTYDEYGVRQYGYDTQFLNGSSIYQYFEIVEFEEDLLNKLKGFVEDKASFNYNGSNIVYDEKFLVERLRSVYGSFLKAKKEGKLLPFETIAKYLYGGTLQENNKKIYNASNNIKLNWDEWVHMAREAKRGKTLSKPVNAVNLFISVLSKDISFNSLHSKLYSHCHCQFLNTDDGRWFEFLSTAQWEEVKTFIINDLAEIKEFYNLSEMRNSTPVGKTGVNELAVFFNKYLTRAITSFRFNN